MYVDACIKVHCVFRTTRNCPNGEQEVDMGVARNAYAKYQRVIEGYRLHCKRRQTHEAETER